jgi:acetyl esterase
MSERLSPEAARVLALIEQAGNAEYHQMAAHEARAAHEERSRALDMEPDPLAHVSDHALPGPAGPMPARAYASATPRGRHPVVLWLHGGGHTVGSIASYDSVCRRLARLSGCLVVSLEYRLAPEHKFPAALDDAWSALAWLTQHAASLGGDPGRVALAGDSAGGNLAATCALLGRDAGLQALRAQVLVYPAVAARPCFESHHEFAEGFLLTAESIRWFQHQYLNRPAERDDWRFAPLQAPDHAGLAPALVMVAGHDPLRDEGIAYADRLRASGNRVELVNHEGMIHAFWSLGGAIREATRSMQRAADFLRRELDGAPLQ